MKLTKRGQKRGVKNDPKMAILAKNDPKSTPFLTDMFQKSTEKTYEIDKKGSKKGVKK